MTTDYIALLPAGYTEDTERGPIYLTAPEDSDDLTQIHGIGEVLEAQLNLNGVYRLEQIAAWNQTNIEAFSSMMPCFQDRIERNYWILQAQRIIERRKVAAPPVPSGFPAGLIQTVLLMSIALLVGLLFVQWLAGGEPATYAGHLRAREFHIVATQPGTVSQVLAIEGEQVLEGQRIATLHDSALDAARTRQMSLVATLQKEVEEARAKAELDLKWRLYEVDKEIISHRQAIAQANEEPPARPIDKASPILETGMPTKTASFSKHGPDLFFSGGKKASATSPGIRILRATQSLKLPTTEQQPAAEPEQAIEDPFTAGYEELQTAERPPVLQQISMQVRTVAMTSAEKIELAEQRIQVLAELKKSLRKTVERAGGLITAEASLEDAKTRLTELNDSQHEIVLKTSGFGIVSKIMCRAGDQVQSGQPVLELVDSRSQYISSLIPSQHVDSIKPGMKVSLYFPGDQHRRGRINSLPVRTTERGDAGETMLEIRIEPLGGLWPSVPIGSEVRVAID
ncbi:MAG: HlyD family efflux transporter periplasmic adaptor subunit [Planctomycetaceae bacterium]